MDPMTPKITTLADLMADYEAERLAIVQKEVEKERAAWDALPKEEQDRLQAESRAKYEAMFEGIDEQDPDEDDEDDDDLDDAEID